MCNVRIWLPNEFPIVSQLDSILFLPLWQFPFIHSSSLSNIYKSFCIWQQLKQEPTWNAIAVEYEKNELSVKSDESELTNDDFEKLTF